MYNITCTGPWTDDDDDVDDDMVFKDSFNI